ncbi:four-carbon acid sugar kinase family protein [Bacillus swezeyi]|uniref:four-carbon acid sugar kinase family protein n=1 Tax=Bacillus swezeyi TaxID=1925020 RepID=UPI0027DCEAE9|nr:four-carbon acid sugar kinase family protein [Bacillus swezeyi]
MNNVKIAIIADDLTGASDCGGQLVHYGLNVFVKIEAEECTERQTSDAVIFNTDSRSMPAARAETAVKKISKQISQTSFDVVYKKIDSTMRGNIGAELNAMYEVFRPDFVVIAPGYPKNGRQVIGGIHYVNGTELHKTEAANDPKTPVTESNIQRLIEKQTGQKCGHLTYEDIRKGSGHLRKKLDDFRAGGMTYVTADSVYESDLERLAFMHVDLPYSMILAGSAGLMSCLPKAFNLKERPLNQSVPPDSLPVLFVVGSVSQTGRMQLCELFAADMAEKVEMMSESVLIGEAAKRKEFKRLKERAAEAWRHSKNIVLCSSDNLIETREIGRKRGLTSIQTSDAVSAALGELAGELIQELAVKRLFLTGGDTAYQVLHQFQIREIRLLDEVEPGIPLGTAGEDLYIVTKAGNFGSRSAITNAAIKLQGG